MNYFSIYKFTLFLKSWHPDLTCSARHFSHCHSRFLLVPLLYLQFNAFCFLLHTIWILEILTTHSLTSYRPKMNINKIYMCDRAERASLEIFRILPKLLFPSMFELVLTNFVCIIWHVSRLLCNICKLMQFPFYILLMSHDMALKTPHKPIRYHYRDNLYRVAQK